MKKTILSEGSNGASWRSRNNPLQFKPMPDVENRRVEEFSEKAAWLVIYAALVGWSCVIIRGFWAF